MFPNIQRAHLVFSGSCNLSCEFCYVQFLKHQPDLALCRRLVLRCAELGIQVLTINGGDPYLFPGIDELIAYANEDCGLKVHVDTNGVCLRERNYKTLSRHVFLLGLPLDGLAPINDRMRGHSGHFEHVRRNLQGLSDSEVTIKVNTCVTRENWNEIQPLARFLDSVRINRWSLYEFWPVEAGLKNRARFEMEQGQFASAVESAKSSMHSFTVEANPVSERVGTYFLFNDLGNLLARTIEDPNRYQTLGSVFDDSVLERWKALEGESNRLAARDRYE